MNKKLELAVADLKEGDYVQATFEELTRPKSHWNCDGSFVKVSSEPTGGYYTTEGYVESSMSDLGETLSISSNGQCLRQPSGAPGGWLVSFKILKKGD